jgi:ADP-ribose pyrophosphatase YjhB (NUDIX family)
MKNKRWSIGGETRKGLSLDDAVIDLTRKECGLEVAPKDIMEIGGSNVRFGLRPLEEIYSVLQLQDGTQIDPRTFVRPGLHESARAFYVKGRGDIRLRGKLEEDPIIVTPQVWETQREELGLDHYVEGLMEISQILLKDDFY